MTADDTTEDTQGSKLELVLIVGLLNSFLTVFSFRAVILLLCVDLMLIFPDLKVEVIPSGLFFLESKINSLIGVLISDRLEA